MRGDHPHRIGVQQIAGAQPLLEEPQDVHLIGKEIRLIRHGQPVLLHLIPGLELPPPRAFAPA